MLLSKYSFSPCENVRPQALSSLQLASINNIINGDKFALFVMQLGDFILTTVLSVIISDYQTVMKISFKKTIPDEERITP